MREILFRGKRQDNNEWIEGCLLRVYERVCRATYQPSGYAIQSAEEWIAPPFVVAETVGQYTGLTDKNGKRIFEGDIIIYVGEVCLVKWDDETAKFVLENKNLLCDFEEVWCNRLKLQTNVIGNIHDNKELLNED